MKILDRLDELREKATLPWSVRVKCIGSGSSYSRHQGYYEITESGKAWITEVDAKPFTFMSDTHPYGDDKPEVGSRGSYIVTACNAEEAMVRVCRAAEIVADHWESGQVHPHYAADDDGIADDFNELIAARNALREIEP